MANDLGSLLIAPHQFIDLHREQALAKEFGLELVVASNQNEFREAMPSAAVVMVTPYAKVGEAELARMKNCRAIVRYGIGYDNIDVKQAARAGVPVSIIPDASSEEVASHAFAMGLMLARRIPQGQAAIAAGNWAGRIGFDTPKMTDLEVGIVGMGRIGRLTARWWKAVGSKVSAYDPLTNFTDVASKPLNAILFSSDVLSLHLPLTPETRNLVSSEVFAKMRPGAVLVNVSRGGLVDETALAQALASGQLAGAALDTFEQEPLPPDSPLRTAPNLVLTPHVAWRSAASLDALQDGAVSRARSALEGRPLPDLVN